MPVSLQPLTRPSPQPIGAGYSASDIDRRLLRDARGYLTEFDGHTLRSAFQPIFSLSHQRAVGYEALLRAERNGSPVAPPAVFGSVEKLEQTVLLDRTCRALHARNFAPLHGNDVWLFLNINSRVVAGGRSYGAFFAELLECNGLAPHQVVVEILENAIHDEDALSETVDHYKELGCLVAIDDFGAGHSNFDRIVRLEPDIVKLDRGILQHAGHTGLARRLLPSLISLLHEAGSLVVLEGVETVDEALLALDADADFAQGYYFARPAPADELTTERDALFRELTAHAGHRQARHDRARAQWLAPYLTVFEQSSASYAAGADAEVALFRLLNRAHVARCYVLDQHGVQVGDNVEPQPGRAGAGRRYAPLLDAAGACWSRKPYFLRAMAEPGRVQVTRPYLSVTGAHMCVTLSVAVEREREIHVLCCDLDASTL